MDGDMNMTVLLEFIFSMLFLFVCCLFLILYEGRIFATLITLFMRYFVLSNEAFFSIGSFHLSLLEPRIFFKNVSYVDKDCVVRIVDGYIVFALTEYMRGRTEWVRLHEFMFSENLLGVSCAVRLDGALVLGTIVEIDSPKRRFGVRVDSSSQRAPLSDLDEGSQSVRLSRGRRHSSKERSDAESTDGGGPPSNRRGSDGQGSSHTLWRGSHKGDGSGLRQRVLDTSITQVSVEVTADGVGGPRMENNPMEWGPTGVRYFDFKDVSIASKPGLCRVHVNGMSFRLFNASSKYRDLARTAALPQHQEDIKGGDEKDEKPRLSEASKAKPTIFHRLIVTIRRCFKSDPTPLGDLVGSNDADVAAAHEAQQNRRNTKSFTQRFFSLVNFVEVEFFGSAINIGGGTPDFPYFLRMTFQRGEGRLFLTRDGCPKVDPFRIAAELALQQVDIRMAKMDGKASEDALIIQKQSLCERAKLMFGFPGEVLDDTVAGANTAEVVAPDLIRNFGVIVDGKDKSDVHLIFYHDIANVYAGEVIDAKSLPKTGLEIIIDAPSVRFGTWMMHCYFKLFNFFNPPNYRPLEPLEFVIGKPRPRPGMECLIEFMQRTRIEVPFKCCKPAPSPPFGIVESNSKGMLVAELGAGSQVIKKASFLLPGQKKQNFEAFFSSKNMKIYTNAVLERDTVFCQFDNLEFFLDRQDDLQWNGPKLWNILTKTSGAKVNLYMCYVNFFRDLINNFYFAENLYHNVPLTTESYNTYAHAVQDFVPNIKQFEVFADGGSTISINANTQNVVYSEDPNDPRSNTFGIIKTQSIDFRLVLPNDQYQLSYVNEVERPFSLSMKDTNLCVSLPPNHPFYKEVDEKTHFGHIDKIDVNGSYIVNVPNQAVPQSRNPTNKSTGRTKCTNYLNIAIEFQNVRGTLMGLHIRVLLNVLDNLFLQNPLTIRPGQLCWFPANQRSHALICKNKESELRNYLASSCFNGNDLEVCVELQFINNMLALTAGKAKTAPGVSLTSSLACLTVVKQIAVTDITFTLNPVMAHVAESLSFLACGPVSFSIIRHFGRLPYKPMVHETLDVRAEGATFELTLSQLVMLWGLINAVGAQFNAEDKDMEVEMEEALLAAESYVHHDWGDLMAGSTLGVGPRRLRRGSETQNEQLDPKGRGQPPPDFAIPPLSFAMNTRQPTPVDAEDPPFVFDASLMQRDRADGNAPAPSVNDNSSTISIEDGLQQMNVKVIGKADGPNDAQLRVSDNRVGKTTLVTSDISDEQMCLTVPLKTSQRPPSSVAESFGPAFPISREVSRRMGVVSTQKQEEALGDNDGSFTTVVDFEKDRVSTDFVCKTSYELGQGFEKFMEETHQAEDNAQDYGIFFANFSILKIQGTVNIGKEGVMTLDLPSGVAVARSTVSDGNSSKRMSAAARSVRLRMLTPKTEELKRYSIPVNKVPALGDFVEVFYIQTSLCSRYYVAYPFDGSLENHQQKQREFVAHHNYEHLLQVPASAPTAAANGTSFTPKNLPTCKLSPSSRRAPSTVVKAAPKQPPSDDTRSKKNANRPSPLMMRCTANLRSPKVDGGVESGGSRGPGPAKGDLFHTGRLGLPKNSDEMDVEDVLSPRGLHSLQEEGPTPPYSAASEALLSLEEVVLHRRGGGRGGGRGSRWGSSASSVDLSELLEAADSNGSAPPSALFATCLSGSASSSLDGDSAYASTVEVSPVKEGWEDPACVEGATGARRKELDTNDECRPAADSYAANEHIPLYAFFRTYFKEEPNERAPTRTEYRAALRGDESSHPAHPYIPFNGLAPSTGFVPSNFPNHFPSYLTAEHVSRMQADAAQLWALRCADHRQRSKANTTSKHLHVEALEPLTGLVTPQAVLLAASALAIVKESMLLSCIKPTSYSSESSAPQLSSQDPLRAHSSGIFSTKPTKKSHTRTQQMRWLNEDFIVDMIIPCTELKLLTSLPISEENLPEGLSGVEGMYCSTLCICETQLVSWQSYPPVGVEAAADNSHKWCGSLHFGVISIITQIEYEPIVRDGGLHIEVPGVMYDMRKDTIAVFYLMLLVVRWKKYKIQVHNGGMCNMVFDKVSSHITRDFFCYLSSLRELATSLGLKIMERLSITSRSPQSFGPTRVFESPASSLLDSKGSLESTQNGKPPPLILSSHLSRLSFDVEHTIEGKISIGSVSLSFIDTKREGKFLKVNLNAVSSIRVMQIKGSFSVMSPQQHGHNRMVRLYCLGGVNSVRLELYSTFLHVIHTHASTYKSQPNAKANPSSSNAPTNSKTATPEVSDTKGNSAGGGGLGALGAPARWKSPFSISFTASVSLQTFSMYLMQSKMNYIEFKGNTLAGFARKYPVKISSRECIRTEVLTEMISRRLKKKLCKIAQRARERAASSRYAAPPPISEQLQLTSTAYFFFQELSLEYIADAFVFPSSTANTGGTNPNEATVPNSASSQKRQQYSKVAVARINQGSLVAEFTDQYNIRGGKQVNVVMHIVTINVDYPYRLRAAETICPQAQALLLEWRQASKWLGSHASWAEQHRLAKVAVPGNMAFTISVQAREMGAVVGLSNSITQSFLLPELSLLMQHSSNGCTNAKAHAHPFTITAKTSGMQNYSVVLPSVYLIWAQDDTRLTSALLVERVAMTVTPIFINHLILGCERFTSEIVMIFSKAMPVEEARSRGRRAGRPARPTNVPIIAASDASAKTHRRKVFLFLLQSVRVSYLTSMTNLRLAIRRVNLTGESSERPSTSTLQWVANVTGAQVALVDRDEHDQLMAAVEAITQNTKPRNSAGKLLPPMPYRPIDTANLMRTVHPLGGFVWGSAEFSFSLSIRKSNSNRALEELRANACFNSYSVDLQNTLVDSLKHFSYQWVLSIYSPLIIVRYGLVELLQQCIQETQEDIIKIKRAEKEEGMHYDDLFKAKKEFRLLQARNKRYEALIKRAEEKRVNRLRQITKRVEKDVKRQRMSIGHDIDDEEEKMFLSFLDIVREYKCVATVFNFQLVLPFGDAAFRSILEKSNDIFSCGKVERHLHSSMCLDRLKFIPTLALKLRIENTSFIASFESVRRFVPMVEQPQGLYFWGDVPFHPSGALAEQHTHLSFTGRFMMSNMYLYFTDGTPVKSSSKLMNLSHKTTVLGGLGELTAYALEEFHHSHNTLFITCVEAPFNVERKSGVIQIRAVMDLPGPQIQLSPQLFNILSELAKESHKGLLHDALYTTSPITPQTHSHVDPSAVDAVAGAAARKRKSRWSVLARRALSNADAAASHHARTSGETEKGEGKKTRKMVTVKLPSVLVFHLDISVRLGTGKMSIFSHTITTDPLKIDPASKAYMSFSRQRRFGRKQANHSEEAHTLDDLLAASSTSTTPAASPSIHHGLSSSQEEHSLSCILSIPLPNVIVEGAMRFGKALKTENSNILRVEVRAGTIELSPGITAIAQEIEHHAKMHGDQQQKNRLEIFSRVQALAKEVPQQNTHLHSSVADLLLPFPRAFATVLLEEEMRNAIQTHCASSTTDTQGSTRDSSSLLQRSLRAVGEQTADLGPVLDNQNRALEEKKKGKEGGHPFDYVAGSFTAIHVMLTDLCIRFTTEPISSTAFTVFLDESGSIDVVVNFSQSSPSPDSDSTHKYSVSSVILCVQHLRAEVQKKLEVKSLEIFLPEAEANISKRSSASEHINHLVVNFPFHMERSNPMLVVRMQHLAQVFTVMQLWTVTTSYTLRRARSLFPKRATPIRVPKLLWSSSEGPNSVTFQNVKRNLMVLCLSNVLCRMDLGSGNSYQLFLSKAHIAAESVRRSADTATYLLNSHFSSFSVRSEGVLSGIASVREIIFHAFMIRNAPHAERVARSSDGRTFRAALIVHDVNLAFKERQLKDIFECKVGQFVIDAMDGVDENNYTTADLNVLLSKGSLGITPSTMPSFLKFVLSVGQTISDEKQIAMDELQKPFPRQLSSVAANFREIAIEINKPFRNGDSLETARSEARMSDRFSSIAAAATCPSESHSTSARNSRIPIAFMGNEILFVPCGQIRFMMKDLMVFFATTTNFNKGSIDCVVINFPMAHLSYAESPCEDYTITKKVLIIETHDVEMYRPGRAKVLILGLKGVNSFEFFTRQGVGEPEVNFALSLHQTHPWTGNPHFTDFEDIFELFRSFKDEKTVNAFHRFGQASEAVGEYDIRAQHDAAGLSHPNSKTEAALTGQSPTVDLRQLKPLRSTKFSPQMAFGGDVSVNMEVILNWLGITERMLPNVLNAQLCDMLEHTLYNLSKVNKKHTS